LYELLGASLLALGLIQPRLTLGNRSIGRLCRRGRASHVETQENLPFFDAVAGLDQHVDNPARRF